MLSAALVAALMATASHAASLPETLTLESAEALALASARPERRAASAALDLARAESLSVRAAAPIEWSVMHARAGESFAGGESRAWELEVSREFDPWGRRSLATQRAGLESQSANLAGAALDSRLRIEAHAALREAAFAERRLARLEALAMGERRLAGRVAARVAEGSMTALEGRLAVLERASVEAQVSRAEAAHVAARSSLARSLGVTDAAWAMRVQLEVSSALDTTSGAIDLDRLLEARPDLAEAKSHVAAAEAGERQSALAGRPGLTLSIGASVESSESGADVFLGDAGGLTGLREDDRGLSARVSALWPGAASARAERAAATAARARAGAELAVLDADLRSDARAAHAAFVRAARTAHAWRALSTQAEGDLERVRAAYADGRLPHADYVSLRRQLVDAVRDALEMEEAHWTTRAAFERAIGTTLEKSGEVR